MPKVSARRPSRTSVRPRVLRVEVDRRAAYRQLPAGPGAQLGQEGRHVGFYSADGEVELLRDLGVGEALTDESEHVDLPSGDARLVQPGRHRGRRAAPARRP